MLSIHGLVKRYGARTVLDDLSLTVEPGTVVAVVGESGTGSPPCSTSSADSNRPIPAP